MIISIITPVFNGADTINGCLSSISSQTYQSIENIVIDGVSTDDTILKVNQSQNNISKIISEPDKNLYDALNKGIKLAQGDFIGILSSDDFFKNRTTIQHVAEYLKKFNPDCLLGNVEIINRNNPKKTIRKYSAKNWNPSHFKYGIMPPHPAVYIKRSFFEKYGYYKLDYKIAADFELLVRILWKHKVSYKYIPETIVTMRGGGISNQGFFKSKRLITKEIMKACKENGLKTNAFLLNLRYLMKLKQLI